VLYFIKKGLFLADPQKLRKIISLYLPKVEKKTQIGNNEIIHEFDKDQILLDCSLVQSMPFVIRSGSNNYLLTSDKNPDLNGSDYILLTKKKPTEKDFKNVNCYRMVETSQIPRYNT
jgi:hypothetical protein